MKSKEIAIAAGALVFLYILITKSIWDDIFLLVLLIIGGAIIFMLGGGVAGLMGDVGKIGGVT